MWILVETNELIDEIDKLYKSPWYAEDEQVARVIKRDAIEMCKACIIDYAKKKNESDEE